MTLLLFVTCWWLIGCASVQLSNYLNKQGAYSEKDVWTLNDLFVELIMGFFGLVATVIVIIEEATKYIKKLLNYDGLWGQYPLRTPKPKSTVYSEAMKKAYEAEKHNTRRDMEDSEQ